ncbi:hypothetical protein BDM02DRAFT_3117400 [Thelephora ganbajun]|uniref:Uncharacterized protein n=1 Tax=Thelephora ganbajun TaxID=370292 RepID=A0ACB6ZCG8_THEGA|nr:hypothetical protein BDM02DRAFT_3117400 [Thelephora ganbajun]
MLQFWLSRRPLQLFSSSSSSSSSLALSYTRGIRTATSPKRLRDRINSPGIGTSQFILKRKHAARRVKVNRFLLTIDKYLEKGEWSDAWECLYRRMELPAMADNKTRFDAYEHAVTLFSSYERFGDAKEIQTTMINEGFIPSLSLRTRMASIAVLTEGAKEEVLLELLQDSLADPQFTELALYQLIRFLGDTMDFSPSSVDAIVQIWVNHHGQISKKKTLSYLIQIHVKRGQLEDAKAWLQRSIEQGTALDAAPFTDLLAGLVRREHTDELTATIANMQKAGIAPDLAVFNTIIYGHIKRLHFKDAIATYNLLFSSRGKELTPDKHTFTNMFTMHLKGLKPRLQVQPADKAQLPPPRTLYNNLIECHLIRTGGWVSLQSEALTTSVLNLALRLFLKTRDYEAAYNIFQTFDICKVPANSTTVSVVLQPLLARILRERRRAAKNDTWLRTLLGPEWYENIEAKGTLFSLTGTAILERLWVIGPLKPQVDPEPQHSDVNLHANPKALSVITGKVDKLSREDLKVLRSIVRRLFYAGAHEMNLDPSVPTASVWKKKVIDAMRDMMPNMKAMSRYFASGRAGKKLKRLAEGGNDKRKRYDLRYLGGG